MNYPQDKIKSLLKVPGYPVEAQDYLLSNGFILRNDGDYVLCPPTMQHGLVIHISIKNNLFHVYFWTTSDSSIQPEVKLIKAESIESLIEAVNFIKLKNPNFIYDNETEG